MKPEATPGAFYHITIGLFLAVAVEKGDWFRSFECKGKMSVTIEERKKRNYMERCLYVEHATFTPLVIGTNGGMGDECEKFLKNLAELLAKEDGEEYADVMMSLRTMLSFQVLRAAVLCVRGSRRPWSQKTSKLSSDFGLSLFEAGLKG